MPYSLGVCASCGYKILTADESEVRRAKKVAEKEKFHFTSKPYEYCPRCSHSLDDAFAVSTSDLDDDPKSKFALVELASKVITSLHTGAEQLRTLADFDGIAENVRSSFSIAGNVNLRVQANDLMSAAEYFREQANSFVDEIIEAAQRVIDGRQQETAEEE